MDGARLVINDVVEKGGPETVRMIQERGGRAILCRADITGESVAV